MVKTEVVARQVSSKELEEISVTAKNEIHRIGDIQRKTYMLEFLALALI